MNESSPLPEDADEVLVHFLAELEHAAEPDQVVAAYCAGYPNRARELREMVELRHILDKSVADIDPCLPVRLGDFRIIRQIDHGGMGIVCEAIQEPFDRRVVVKMIRQGRTIFESRERFLREQRVLAELHQTHIVPVFAAGEEADIQYFVMPYIDGVNLHRLIGTARVHGIRCPGDKMPRVAELVETAKTFDAARDTDRRLTSPTRRGVVTARSQPPAADTAPPTLPAPQPITPDASALQLTLSIDYYRSVARIMSDVAESVHHAHEHDFIHRDLKPSNIMVDPAGQSWLIDFGLARHLHGDPTSVVHADTACLAGHPAHTVGPVGTPGYMAPEQLSGQRVGIWTDVWGLGVVLYELSTLQRAFPTQRKLDAAVTADRLGHVPPRKLVKNYPRDLEAICEKALRPNPTDRYATAQLFADDLQRWLRGDPTTARPARAPRRVLLWARRNKAWAAVLAALIVTAVSVASAAFQVQRTELVQARREAEIATRGQWMLQAQMLVAHKDTAGWSTRAWELCGAAAKVERGSDVRDLAVATLAGWDARRCKRFVDANSTCLLFDKQGRQLLMNTVVGWQGLNSGQRVPVPGLARMWDAKTDEVHELAAAHDGPVAFADDAPRQLVVTDDRTSLCWIDLRSQEVVRRFVIPPDLLPVQAIVTYVTADGSTIAATGTGRENQGYVLVWDGRSGQLLQQLSTVVESLALSPDGVLLALGDKNGDITVRSIRNQDELRVLRGRGHQTQSLAFGRDPRRNAQSEVESKRCGWLLAAGHVGGPVTIWDVERTVPLSYCRGSAYFVWNLAFSPDGATLASADHSYRVRLWDVMTGQPLLVIDVGSEATCVVFSPDGMKLAANCADKERGVTVWDLELDRGIKTLRGLESPIANLCMAENESAVAANTHDFQVGIWNLRNGALRHILEVPKSQWADNAALAFSPDGTRFAFAAGRQASLWNVETGEKIATWPLHEGLVDLLAFAGTERLLSFRVETLSGETGPFSKTSYEKDPRVYRIRDLMSENPLQPLAEITDFRRSVLAAACTPDGSRFLVEGFGGPTSEQRMLKIFDTTGREVQSLPTTRTVRDSVLILDPSGKTLAVLAEDGPVATLMEFPSGKFLGRLDGTPACLAPRAAQWVKIGTPAEPPCGLWLCRPSDSQSVSLVGFDLGSNITRAKFSHTGTLVAWGNANGTVSVSSIPTVHRRLAEIGLDWQ
jgi:serine/threonine protein kinase/WD40 repeat protein